MSIVPNTYIVRRGDSLPRIALAYTGRQERWRELVTANPQWKLSWQRTPYGYEKMPVSLAIGSTMFLPLDWPRVPRVSLPVVELPESVGLVGAGALSDDDPGGVKSYTSMLADENDAVDVSVGGGDSCDVGGKCGESDSPITNIKPYVYRANMSQMPYELAKKWTGNGMRWKELRRANYDDPDGFQYDKTCTCNWTIWDGKKLKIPASWPDPPKGVALWQNIEPTGNLQLIPAGQPVPPAGTSPLQPTAGGVVPAAYAPTSTTSLPAQSASSSMWGWLAGGALVGGSAIYLASLLTKEETKKTPVSQTKKGQRR